MEMQTSDMDAQSNLKFQIFRENFKTYQWKLDSEKQASNVLKWRFLPTKQKSTEIVLQLPLKNSILWYGI